MKKYHTYIIPIFIFSILITYVMPFNIIKADTGTYYDFPQQTCIPYDYSNSSPLTLQISKDSRLVVIETASRWKLYAVSLINNSKYSTSTSCPISNVQNGGGSGFDSSTYNGNRYYWTQIYWSSSYIFNTEIPVYTDKSLSNLSDNSNLAYRLTYGDMVVDPAPPIQAGQLTFNYYTDFASTQQNNVNALKSNRDTIIWDYDTSNSNIPGIDLKVDIRAVPTDYYASTEDDLNSLTWSDLHLEASYAADLGSYQMNWNNRQVSFTWEDVVNSISINTNLPEIFNNMINFWNFKAFNLNNQWYWTGWVYQIRLNTFSGDYTGEWQTIYQISSAPPEGSSQTINYYVTGSGLTEPVYQTIQNVNNQNNITNNTWYVNGNPFDVNGQEGDNWLSKLLELILDAVFGTLGKLIDAITDLLIGSLEAIIDFFKTIWDRFLNLFEVINFTNDNQEYDLDIPQGESFLDIIPAFIRGMGSAGISYMIWIPLVVGIIFMVL